MNVLTGARLKKFGITPCCCALVLDGSNASLSHHGITIAEYDAESQTLTLNNGGYYSATTKKRMNQFCRAFCPRYSVYQKQYNWYVRDSKTGVEREYRHNKKSGA